LGYPSGHPDPHSSMIASAVESQSTAGSAATGISTATTGSATTKLIARQPPIGIETAAASNPTLAPCSYFVYKETLREMRIIKNEKKYSTSIKFYDSPGK